MKLNPLPPVALLREVFELNPETGVLTFKVTPRDWRYQENPKRPAGTINNYGYLIVALPKKPDEKAVRMLAHRVVYALHTGEDPYPYPVDHINANKLDNRPANLQRVTQMENVQKQSVRSNSTTGVRGVYWHEQCQQWVARIKVNYKTIHLGLFKTVEEAAKARQIAEAKYYTIERK